MKKKKSFMPRLWVLTGYHEKEKKKIMVVSPHKATCLTILGVIISKDDMVVGGMEIFIYIYIYVKYYP